MISGVVYFEEILAGIKDDTGIEALESQYPKIRRWMARAEKAIGGGGLVIRKKKTYLTGDGSYNGYVLKLPEDFIWEQSYGSINSAYFRGDKLELKEQPGPDSIDLFYMGYLADTNGNPLTTHNHMDAVIAYCSWKMYQSRVFHGISGTSARQNQVFKEDWLNLRDASRGNDAFPSEEEWIEIGQILRQPFSAVMTDCGFQDISEYQEGLESTQPIDGGEGGGDCGDLTIDMVQIYEDAKNT
jgi:hypothetical protein